MRSPIFFNQTVNLWLAASLLLMLSTSPVSAATFNGTLTLAAGISAAGGSTWKVRTLDRESFTDGGGIPRVSEDIIFIPAFQTSRPFSFQLPNSPAFSSHVIQFECISGCQNLDITTVGLWNVIDGVVGTREKASLFSSAQNQSINILLEEADVFAGTIKLPEGKTTSGSETIQLIVKSSSFSNPATFIQSITPSGGASQIPFNVGVATSATLGSWVVNMLCVSCGVEIEAQTHYPTTISGDPTSLESFRSFFYQKGSDYEDLRLTLIAVEEPEPPEPPAPPVPTMPAISILLSDD